MTDLTLSFVPETGQAVMQGPSAGAAGAAELIPVPGLALAFDCVDGGLSRVVVDLAGADEFSVKAEISLDPRVAVMLTGLFGADAPTLLLSVATEASGESRDMRLRYAESDPIRALSRLARLESARVASPLQPGSPWWAAETADLAGPAGLPELALDEARQVIHPLLSWLQERHLRCLPQEAASAIRTVAAITVDTAPQSASRLLSALESRSGAPVASSPAPAFDVAAEVAAVSLGSAPRAALHWMIDPDLLGPGGLFRPGLSPYSDLVVRRAADRTGTCRLTVTAQPTGPVVSHALSRCLVRVVDPAARRILAQAPFADAAALTSGPSIAEFPVAYPLDELEESWIEVVTSKTQPVLSTRGYRSRRARRWADAALRAERAPWGLAPQATASDWVELAVAAWEQSARDWAAAGDGTRAQQARQRRDDVASARTVTRRSVAASRAERPGPGCLAESLG